MAKKSKKHSTPRRSTRVSKKRKRDEPSTQDTIAPNKVASSTRNCEICLETKLVYRNFPKVSTCTHEPVVCIECYGRHTVTKIQDNRAQGWDACTCPRCGLAISKENLQGILPRTIGREIERLIKETLDRQSTNWLWCPAPGCGYGEVHKPSTTSMVKCSRCSTKSCLHHQMLWHNDLTCVEYDQTQIESQKARNLQKDLAKIKKTTKACPFCGVRIKKEGGCNHMNCTRCHKYFLWDNVAFDGEEKATSAEEAGGAELDNRLPPDQRAQIEQIMRVQNGEGEVLLPPPQAPAPPIMPLAGLDAVGLPGIHAAPERVMLVGGQPM